MKNNNKENNDDILLGDEWSDKVSLIEIIVITNNINITNHFRMNSLNQTYIMIQMC